MNITCYQNFSKKPNSTARPSSTGTLHSCVFKDDCSIVSPVFLLDGVDLSVNYVQFNNRYYFVRDIVLQNRNIYELHCEIDVLATWKSQIGSSYQYILRSSDESDDSITDIFYPAKKEPVVKSKTLTNVSSPTWATSLDSGAYIVGIISGEGTHAGAISQGCVQYYYMRSQDFNYFARTIFTESNWADFQNRDRFSFNPIQYVTSVMWFPFAPPFAATGLTAVKFGWVTMNFQCFPLTAATASYNYTVAVDKHPQAATRGSYLSAAPYSEYCLSFPPFGSITLDPDVCAVSSLINIIHKIDFITGKSMLVGRELFTGGVYEYFRREVQLGVNLQLAQIAANRLGVAQDIIGSVGNVVDNIASGRIFGAIASGVSGIMSGIQNAQPHVQTTGSNDSLISVLDFGVSPFLFERYYEIVDEDNTNHGRPLCQRRQISSLPGFILCANSEVSITGTLDEKERIRQYMDAGFFYE